MIRTIILIGAVFFLLLTGILKPCYAQGFLSDSISLTDTVLLDDAIQVVVLEGVVTDTSRYTYIRLPFQVPEHTGMIRVDFLYNSYRNEVEIGIFDPQRFRGTSRFSKTDFFIAETHATASYFPGILPAGEWAISLGFPVVNTDVSYKITIEIIPKNNPVYVGPSHLSLNPDARWYSGDFHTHTGHSDGFGCTDTQGRRTPCQVYQVARAAHERALDFVAIADHNTVSHHQDITTLQPAYPNLLLLQSQEVTTFYGHATVHGTRLPVDFRLGYAHNTILKQQHSVKASGALLVLVHPGRPTGDSCTGCGWSEETTDYSLIEAIEIVNGTQVETAISGIPFWQNLLNQGYRITAVGGSDDHGAGQGRDKPGTPTTVVYAQRLSEAALLEGVRSGMVYLKTGGPDTPDADFYALNGEHRVEMGHVVQAGSALTWHTTFDSTEPAMVEIILNGQLYRSVPIPANHSQALPVAVELPSEKGWIRANIRQNDAIIVISNPIYFE